MHAITAANNLLCACIDNHLQQGNSLGIDPRRIVFKRCMDMNDRALRHCIVGLGGKINGVPREDSFQITVASEVMAILCLADDLTDLKKRLGRILVAYKYDNSPVYADDLGVTGSMAALLRDAIKPNLVQTLENTPVLMHGGRSPTSPTDAIPSRQRASLSSSAITASQRRDSAPTSERKSFLISNAAMLTCGQAQWWWSPRCAR